MRRLLKEKAGFSLVEVMVALVIGAIGLLALSGILTYTMTMNRDATDVSIATALARQKIEQIKITDYNYVLDQTENNLDQNGNTVSGAKYTRVTDVQNNTPAFNTKTVTVTVYYDSDVSDEAVRKAEITTIIYP